MRLSNQTTQDVDRARRVKREMHAEREARRVTRFEVWREGPNVRDRPYRRLGDRTRTMAWQHDPKPTTWTEVLALIKRGQRIRIRTYIPYGRRRWAPSRVIRVNIVNRGSKFDRAA